MNRHGGHISFFSPKSLNQLALQTGFSTVKVVTHFVKFYEKDELPYILRPLHDGPLLAQQ